MEAFNATAATVKIDVSFGGCTPTYSQSQSSFADEIAETRRKNARRRDLHRAR